MVKALLSPRFMYDYAKYDISVNYVIVKINVSRTIVTLRDVDLLLDARLSTSTCPSFSKPSGVLRIHSKIKWPKEANSFRICKQGLDCL